MKKIKFFLISLFSINILINPTNTQQPNIKNFDKKKENKGKNIYKSFNPSFYELSPYLISANLTFANYDINEINSTSRYTINDTHFDFTEKIKENSQRFNLKIIKFYDKDVEKEYHNIKLKENFAETNQFYIFKETPDPEPKSDSKDNEINQQFESSFKPLGYDYKYHLDLFDYNEIKCTVNYPGLFFNKTNLFKSDTNYSLGFKKNITDNYSSNLPKDSNDYFYEKLKIFNDINIFTKIDQKGIFIQKYYEGNLLNETTLGNLLIKEDKSYNLDDKYYEDFYLTENNQENKSYIILKEKKSLNIFLVEILSNQNDMETFKPSLINFHFNLLNIFNKEQFYSINLNYILSFNVLKGKYFLISVNENYENKEKKYLENTDMSINLVSYSTRIENINKIKSFKESVSQEKEEKEISLDIIDIRIRGDNCYMAIRDYGLVNFLLSEGKFEVIFKHRKIERFILSNKDKNFYGILLNNDYIKPNFNELNNNLTKDLEDSREFYIELINNKNNSNTDNNNESTKYNLTINKIFHSNKTLNAQFYKNFIHDEISENLFFISYQENLIYYTKLNLPNLYNNIDGKFPITENFFDKKIQGFNLLNNKEKIPSENLLVLQERSKEKVIFWDFGLNESANYHCTIKNSGNFTVINSFIRYKENEYRKENNLRLVQILLNEDEEEFSLFWIILILFVLLILIAGLIFYFYNKKKKLNNTLIYNFAKLEEL